MFYRVQRGFRLVKRKEYNKINIQRFKVILASGKSWAKQLTKT